MEKSESIKEIANALCKFQAEVEKIKKGATNPFFKSKYATLADILDVIRQPLANNGLSFVQFPKGVHGLETMLMHTSGEYLAESYEMKPTKDDPQGAGSVITYQRRYALGAVLGLNIDEDDDGNKASAPVPPKEVKKDLLTPDHVNWDKAVKYVSDGGNITDLTKKYIFDGKTEKLLINAAIHE
jgi:hypothetical protein